MPLAQLKTSKQDSGVLFNGYITVPKDGDYTFSLTTSSKALLRLHGAIVINADANYKAGTEAKGTIRLQADRHPLHLYTFQHKTGAPALKLQWSSAEKPLYVIPVGAFTH